MASIATKHFLVAVLVMAKVKVNANNNNNAQPNAIRNQNVLPNANNQFNARLNANKPLFNNIVNHVVMIRLSQARQAATILPLQAQALTVVIDMEALTAVIQATALLQARAKIATEKINVQKARVRAKAIAIKADSSFA